MSMKLHEALSIDLNKIDDALRQVILTDPDVQQASLISSSILRLIGSGGKRLRPMLVIVGSRFGIDANSTRTQTSHSSITSNTSNISPIIRIAAILEYLHMASLIHDDIIDRSDLRRNEPTLHKLTNVYTATHIANYMMARSLEWAALSHNDDVVRIVGATSVLTQLCMGEYQQLYNQFNFDITLEQYLEKTKNKTALLMANCLRSGAESAKADETTCQFLFDFGLCIGMVFQIHDDLLDYTHSQDAIGKPAGSDLGNGHVTLPVILALEDPRLSSHIRSLHADSTIEDVQQVVALIVNSDVMERAQSLCLSYIDKANQIIDELKAHPAHTDLRVLLDYFV